MPVSESIQSLYRSGLEKFIATPESGFANLDSNEYGIGVNAFNNSFAQVNNITNEDMSELSKESAPILQQFKSSANIPRFIPKQEDFATYYTPLNYGDDDTIENKIATIDQWKTDSLAKASSLRPSDSEDFKYHLEGVANNLIRQEVGKNNKTSWVGDKTYRTIEGFARMGTAFGDFEWANRFLAENLPEDPERDQDMSSLFASGIGELASQALVATITAATAGPEAIPFALSSLYSARAMKEGFDEQFAKDGNEMKAMDAAVASIPGALLETVADNLLFKSGSALRKTFADEFLNAATDAAKREVLKKAMPEIGKEILKNGITEGTVGSIGADFTTGYGRYLATGDESYIPKPEDLLKGALVEGVLGAGYTALNSSSINASGASDISKELFTQNAEKQSKIFQALKARDYEAAVNIANDTSVANTVTESTPEPTGEVNETQSSINPSKFQMPFKSASRIAETAKSLRTAGNIAEADRLDSVVASIKAGTFTIPESFSKNTSFVGDEVSATPDTGITTNDITLEDGTVLPKDKNIVFVQGLTPASAVEISERFGGVSLMINQNTTDSASLVWKENGANKKSANFKFSTTPRKNFIPVEIPNLTFISDGVAVSSSFSFVNNGSPVSSYKKTDASKGIIRQNPQQQTPANDAEAQANSVIEDYGVTKAMEVLDALENNSIQEYAGNFNEDLDIALDGLRDYSDRMEAEGNTDAFIAANEMAENIISLYSDIKQPEPQRWPIPRSSNITRPTNIFAENITTEPEGPMVEYQGTRGNLITNEDGIFVGDVLVSNNTNLPLEEIEGLRQLPVPSTEFTLGPDSSGRMYKFENGFKVFENGESIKIVNKKGNRTGLNPVTQPNLPTYPVSVSASTEAAITLTENPTAVVTLGDTEVTNFNDQLPINPTLNELQATEASILEEQNEVDNFNNVTIKKEIEEQVQALEESGLDTVPELLASDSVSQEVKDSIIFNNESPSFQSVVEDFISTITNEKGKASWNGKVADAVVYYESGANLDSKGSLSDTQVRALDRLIQNYDSSLGRKIRREQQANDKVSKELVDSEKAPMQRFSNATENVSNNISMEEAASYLIDNNLGFIRIHNTAKVSQVGLQWKGHASFSEDSDAVISVNVNNISSVADLRNTINEEIGHVIYNNPDLRASLDSIIANTPINSDLLNQGYTEIELAEESAVKNFASLIDQYNGTGTFKRLIDAIRVYIKDAFGLELNNRDLQYIANRALNRAVKNPDLLRVRANRDGSFSRFSNAENTSNNITAFEESDILSQINGLISPKVKEIRKRLDRVLNSKLEQKLVIDEPEIWKSIKTLHFQHLNESDLEIYKDIVDDFANTRRKMRGRPIETTQRYNQDELRDELSRLNKAAEQGEFDYLQKDNEFLQSKDFQRDYSGDLDLVNQAVRDVNLATDTNSGNPNARLDDRDEYIYKILDLQEWVGDNAKNRFDEAFAEIQPPATGSEIVNKRISKFNEIVNSHVAKERARAEQTYNQLMTDPTQLSFKDARQRYYSLMSFISDGYMLNASNFISEEAMAILQTQVEDKDRLVPFNSRTGMELFQNSASFATNIRRMGNKMADLMFKLTTPFRTGIEDAERVHNEFVKPSLAEAQAFREKQSGKKYTNYDQNVMGLYAIGKNHKTTETVAQGMMYNKQYFLDSIKKLKNDFDPAMARAMAKMEENVKLLFSGISNNMTSKEALEIYERNADALGIDAGMKGYVSDAIAIGEATRGLAKYTTEFVYGSHFTEWANYIPVFAIENPGVAHVDLVPVQGSAEDQVLGNLSDNTNMVTSGLGSTKERGRRLGDSKVLVFNLNAMVEGRTRINILDYMTASPRRELNNIISSKGNAFPQLANLLKDGGEYGNQGRISHVQKTIRTMWNNSIQNASYISPAQGMINQVMNMWASVKLSSFYQLPAQFASNLMPYFIVNATNPQKISRFFEASNILLKYRAGTLKDERLKGTVERLLYAIESRQQDVFLDKSVALDVDGTGMFNMFKNTELGRSVLQGARTLNKVRENVLFWQFKTSDHLSGAPMLLADYMDREVQAGRATDWNGLTFNEESYFRSIDEIERFIGIGGASRRGVWLNGKNGWMTLFRNMISAFSSHRINNATNFRGELFKLTNNNLSLSERMESARYMTAIAGQSALFTIMKASMVGFFYNMLADKMGEEENEKELEAYYKQLMSGNYRKEDRKIIQAEISLREKVRNEFKRVKDQATNAEVIGMSMLKDTLANSFVFPAITDLPLNAVIHAFYDQHEADAFKKVKEATIEDYQEKLKLAKASGNTSLQIDLQKQISQWQSQEAIQMVYPNMSIIPFDGAYGGVLKDGYRFMEKGAGVLMGTDTMSLNDMFMGFGLLGIGQADINRISRLVSKQQDFEKEYQESIDKIRQSAEDKRNR